MITSGDMAKIKSERHHWWPECVSEYWADDQGGVHWLLPDGEIRRSTPNNFGVIGNGHHIKMGGNSDVPNPWDSSFEEEFSKADSNFPGIIDWLDTLDRCDPPFERPVASRMRAQVVDDDRFGLLIECLLSLAARSPMYREKGVALAEHYRGPLPERERNVIIGYNISRALRNAVRGIGGGGKALVIYSPEREFIFGDGFFHNLTVQGEHWHHPKLFVPLTPWTSVLFTRPMSYMTLPKLVTLVASAEEAVALNYAVQVYSRNAIFYRSEKPVVDEAYTQGRHLVFADHRNTIDELIYEIPGVPPRDTRMDDFDDMLRARRPKS